PHAGFFSPSTKGSVSPFPGQASPLSARRVLRAGSQEAIIDLHERRHLRGVNSHEPGRHFCSGNRDRIHSRAGRVPGGSLPRCREGWGGGGGGGRRVPRGGGRPWEGGGPPWPPAEEPIGGEQETVTVSYKPMEQIGEGDRQATGPAGTPPECLAQPRQLGEYR